MKRTLHFTVEVAVEDDCDLPTADLAAGFRQAITRSLASNAVLPASMAASMIREVTVDFSHSTDDIGNCTPEIHRVLFCSTAHLSEDTRGWMMTADSIGPIYDPIDAGYLIRVPLPEEADPDEPETSWAKDVQDLLARARAERCSYIRLDRDANLLAGLTYYDR